MNTNNSIKLLKYCSSNSRNKIVISKNKQNSFPIEPINIGRELSKKIKDNTDEKFLTFIVTEITEQILTENIVNNKEYGDLLYLTNIGILLEPSLKVNFEEFLNKYSQSNCLIIDWPGTVDHDYIYFLSKEKGIEINLSKLSHIIL